MNPRLETLIAAAQEGDDELSRVLAEQPVPLVDGDHLSLIHI